MRESTQKKRQYVIDVALNMFMEKGYDQISVNDIIHATNLSKGTFYHYFKSKDDIINEFTHRQYHIIDSWMKRTPLEVFSLEGHINRLLLDLAAAISHAPKLIRSLTALQMHNEQIKDAHQKQIAFLKRALLKWLPDEQKVQALITTFLGTVFEWCKVDEADLEELLEHNLTMLWSGLRHNEKPEFVVEPRASKPLVKVAIIGGGLAGLTAAAYLSESEAIEGVLFERSPQLGGRAFTYEKEGFTLNFGAHAIYGIDRHEISILERELGLSFSSKEVNRRKVMYEKFDQISPAPLDFVNLVKTDLLSTMQKIRFATEISSVMTQLDQIKKHRTLGDYLEASQANDQVKELWEHIVCSNFFITPEDARRVPGHVISSYYNNLFRSKRPVNYILGSWAVITNQLTQKTELSDRWEIAVREGVEQVRSDGDRYIITTKQREMTFDHVIFAMPVQQVVRMLKGTEWETAIKPYEHSSPTEVLVHDVGLSEVVARPFSYISDMNNKMFITDISATDATLSPEGGQLLQGVAYLSENPDWSNEERRAYLDERMAKMEALFDRHYPGWRQVVNVKRVSKKAMVQSVKDIDANKMLPNRLENVPFYFCGDGCEGKGQLAERAFSSARYVASLLLDQIGA